MGPRSAAEQAIIAFSQSELLEQQTAADKDPKDSSYSRTLGQENGLCCALNSLNLQLEDKKKKKPTKLTPEEHAQRKARLHTDLQLCFDVFCNSYALFCENTCLGISVPLGLAPTADWGMTSGKQRCHGDLALK